MKVSQAAIFPSTLPLPLILFFLRGQGTWKRDIFLQSGSDKALVKSWGPEECPSYRSVGGGPAPRCHLGLHLDGNKDDNCTQLSFPDALWCWKKMVLAPAHILGLT